MPTLFRHNLNRRAFLRGAGQTAAAISAAGLLPLASSAAQTLPANVEPTLAEFVVRYMRVMGAPGLTLALTHADGSTTAAGFGLSDIDKKLPVTPAMLFQIGSISKSFCALALLQMRDEGKLDLKKPILDYLPWLPIDTPYGAITVHHLLTHSSGLPGNVPLFSADRNARILQGYKPGSQFHYCNLGFQILGRLAAMIDNRSYNAVLQARLLDPLGMTSSHPFISNTIRSQESESYVIRRDDLSGTRSAELSVAPRAIFTNAAGCIVSTPADMNRYMAMLLAHGKGPHGRIVSEEGFALFATPFIEAEEFGPGTHYGYGIAVDTLDGHKLLRHTGGMQSFASSIQVDLDAKVGAFASINAMQGYRPNPVTKYAIQSLRAEAEKKPLPQADPLPDPLEISDAPDYAGAYSGESGTVQVVAEGKSLYVISGSTRIQLARAAGDTFVATDEAWQAYPWAFGREKPAGATATGKVSEMGFGAKWYTNAAYTGPKTFATPKHLAAFVGVYDSGTDGMEAYIWKGALVVGGGTLEPLGEGIFRFSDEPNNPETIEFLHVIDGHAQLAILNGEAMERIEIA
jgi:CubicO group peptidase (beta-lactamase class C family)